jgi:flagellar protein FlbD
MIELTRLHNEKVVVNAELIEFVEATPDTLVSTTTGKKLMVKESVGEVVELVVAYRRRCLPLAAPAAAERGDAAQNAPTG